MTSNKAPIFIINDSSSRLDDEEFKTRLEKDSDEIYTLSIYNGNLFDLSQLKDCKNLEVLSVIDCNMLLNVSTLAEFPSLNSLYFNKSLEAFSSSTYKLKVKSFIAVDSFLFGLSELECSDYLSLYHSWFNLKGLRLLFPENACIERISLIDMKVMVDTPIAKFPIYYIRQKDIKKILEIKNLLIHVNYLPECFKELSNRNVKNCTIKTYTKREYGY